MCVGFKVSFFINKFESAAHLHKNSSWQTKTEGSMSGCGQCHQREERDATATELLTVGLCTYT